MPATAPESALDSVHMQARQDALTNKCTLCHVKRILPKQRVVALLGAPVRVLAYLNQSAGADEAPLSSQSMQMAGLSLNIVQTRANIQYCIKPSVVISYDSLAKALVRAPVV